MRNKFFTTLVISLFFYAGCKTNPSTGRRQFILVSSDQVTAMGVEAKPQLIQQYGGEVKEPELRKYVASVGWRLAEHVEPEYGNIEWEFITLDSDVINAFALPGGKVFLSRGLLEKFDNEAQIAGVLGHEIGHVTAKHIDERISQSLAFDLGLAIGGEFTESQLALTTAEMFGKGYLLKFNRDQESESDRQGLKYMTRAGYDPQGMVEVIQVLIEASEGNSTPEILSTHPDPKRRLRDTTRQIQDDYKHTQKNPSFGKFKGRFNRQAAPYLTPRQ